MQYFIGIVPPQDFKQKIVNFQNHAFNDQPPEIVEPHITVKAQAGLTGDLKWLEKVKKVCSTFPAFHLAVGEPRTFGSAILYLGTDTQEVIYLHKQLVEAIGPLKEESERYFELDLYTAHMTLAQTSWGFSEAALVKLKEEVGEELSTAISFIVDFIRVYHEYEPGRYKPYMDIPLEG